MNNDLGTLLVTKNHNDAKQLIYGDKCIGLQQLKIYKSDAEEVYINDVHDLQVVDIRFNEKIKLLVLGRNLVNLKYLNVVEQPSFSFESTYESLSYINFEGVIFNKNNPFSLYWRFPNLLDLSLLYCTFEGNVLLKRNKLTRLTIEDCNITNLYIQPKVYTINNISFKKNVIGTINFKKEGSYFNNKLLLHPKNENRVILGYKMV